MLKHFEIDTSRDLLYPDLECYQMNLKGLVDDLINSGKIQDEEFKLLPSWSKYVANPHKGKHFFIQMLKATILGELGYDDLSLENQSYKTPKVFQMFCSANNKELLIMGEQAEQALPGFTVLPLCGSYKYNGKRVTNKNSEKIVKEVIESGKPLLILCNNIAQRSFSIPELHDVLLAYDGGQIGSTMQKLSRALTPDDLDKIGRVWSLSFDSNRDDKFDAMIVETARNITKRKGGEFVDNMEGVLRTLPIFNTTQEGRVQIDVDTYLPKAMASNRLGRIIGKCIDMSLMTPEEITSVALGNVDYAKMSRKQKAKTGDTRSEKQSKATGKSRTSEQQKEYAVAREVLVTIVENLDIIVYGTNSKSILDAVEVIKQDEHSQQYIESEFNVDINTIIALIDRGIINDDYVKCMLKVA